MLWMKGWFETRWRFLFGLGFGVFVLASVASDGAKFVTGQKLSVNGGNTLA